MGSFSSSGTSMNLVKARATLESRLSAIRPSSGQVSVRLSNILPLCPTRGIYGFR